MAKGSSQRRAFAASDRLRLMLLASVILTVVLYVVPYGDYLIYPLLLISTLVHELGHGLAAVLVGGSFERLTMWPDGSGAAMYGSSGGRLTTAIVAGGGLLGPAVAAALGFVAGRTVKGARRALLAISGLLLICLLLVVRGAFAWFFVLGILFLCIWLARRAGPEVAQLSVIFLAIQLALSVFSRADYLFTPVAQTSGGTMPSDVAQIASALWLPYWLWGGLFAAISIAVLILGLRHFWR